MQKIPFDNDSRIPEELEQEIDLFAYLTPILERKWSVLGIFLLVTLATASIVLKIPSSYQSTVVLLIAEPPNTVGIRNDTQPEARDLRYFQTQVEALQSRSLAQQVIEHLALYNEPEFMPESPDADVSTWPDWLPDSWSPARLKDGLLSLGGGTDSESSAQDNADLSARLLVPFSNRLLVEPVPNSQLVNVSFEARDPALAARVANAVARVYIDSNRELRQASSRQTAEDLKEQLDDLGAQLDSSEKALQDFRESEGIIEMGGTTLTRGRINLLNQQLVDAQRRFIEVEYNYQQVLNARDQPPQYLFSLPLLQQDQLLQTLLLSRVAREGELVRYRKLLGARHPRIITLTSDLESARKAINDRLASIVANMERELESAQASLEEIRQVMRETEKEMQGENRIAFQHERLQREVDTHRRLHEVFLNRLREMEVILQTANARIVDEGSIPAEPFKPDRPKLLLLGAIAGFCLGIGWAFFREFTNTTPRHIEDVGNKLDVPVLGFLPMIKLGGRKENRQTTALYYRDKPRSPFAEAIRTLRMGVVFSRPDYPRKIIMVTSSVPGEGKSTIAMNLAVALARESEVLLIDADLRQPTQGTACDLEQSAAGLSQYLIGREDLAACLYPVWYTNVLLMPSGVIPPNPLDLLSSKIFSTLLEKQQQIFQYIVIDSPPVLAVSDWVALSKLANAVILVAKANSTSYKILRSTIKQLEKVNAPLSGLVLNQVKTKHMSGYGYGYGYGSKEEPPRSTSAKATQV